MPKKTLSHKKLIAHAKMVLQMYNDDQFDNFQDPILEFQYLLKKVPKKEKDIHDQLQKALDEATTILKQDMKGDKELAAYVKELGFIKTEQKKSSKKK